ncbi:hypothetical protein AVEN_14227-1 [Araneus ventricosus]|uniref:Pre-C2HC domain-containing protein n=1 Tax=Araneus ventricosus TaxID=182803 RepID=A0A4Y2GKD2_ARAVE|nr:hypothetical protein AVEN_14227-1 [Araneus ventricosus]
MCRCEANFFLLDITTDTILQEIAEEIEQENDLSIKGIRRFAKRTNGTVLPSDKVLVTAYGTTLPPEIRIWYANQKLRLFIDNPRRCSNCQAFNHSTRSCKPNSIRCGKCSEAHPPILMRHVPLHQSSVPTVN